MSNAVNINFKVALETVPNISGPFHLLPQFSCVPELGQGSGARRLGETTCVRPERTGQLRGQVPGSQSPLEVLSLPPTIWGTLGKSLIHSVLQFPHLQNGKNRSGCHTEWL